VHKSSRRAAPGIDSISSVVANFIRLLFICVKTKRLSGFQEEEVEDMTLRQNKSHLSRDIHTESKGPSRGRVPGGSTL
jgi:hypothetical protein